MLWCGLACVACHVLSRVSGAAIAEAALDSDDDQASQQQPHVASLIMSLSSSDRNDAEAPETLHVAQPRWYAEADAGNIILESFPLVQHMLRDTSRAGAETAAAAEPHCLMGLLRRLTLAWASFNAIF